MSVKQLQLLLSNEPQVVSSGVEANDLGAYFMRSLTKLQNIPSVSVFRSLSIDDEEAFEKLQDMESLLSRQMVG
ncbi:hypothetical protein HAX54_021462 [Datura stramonium]|uniref:Uncharacterized protein n=1 Tax=Datura stramonium TaxID=4076 RepID=A0ABS8UUT2_DATST|nr:hypothetical protein [Datura stramonium]